MPANLTLEKVIEDKILSSIKEEIEKVKEQIIKRAQEDFDKYIRERIASVAISAAEFYSVQRMGPDLVIHVKMESSK